MSKARALHNESSLGGRSAKRPPVVLHRCIRVASLAALLIIVPAGVFAHDVTGFNLDVHADGGSVVVP